MLDDKAFEQKWFELFRCCSWSGPYQHPTLVRVWYEKYSNDLTPVLVFESDENARLVGLLCLALDEKSCAISVAGAHQAEYQAWLESSGAGPQSGFLTRAIGELRAEYPGVSLRFRYVPKDVPIELLFHLQNSDRRLEVKWHRRPIWRLDAGAVASSLRKKSNKSRINRIKRLGTLAFKRVVDADAELESLRTAFEYYDFRQGAINDSCPFVDDGHKEAFHLELMRRCPDLIHVTVMTVDDEPIACHVGFVGTDIVHLAILSYAPALSNLSPGKVHMLFLGNLLSESGVTAIDLTPGEDAWKERFASDNDEVAEIIIHKNYLSRAKVHLVDRCKAIVKRGLRLLGASPSGVWTAVEKLRNLQVGAIRRKFSQLKCREIRYRVFSQNVAAWSTTSPSAEILVGRNKLSDLLLFQPSEVWHSRQGFLSAALVRIEQKESVYSIAIDGKLLHWGWLVQSQDKATFSEVNQQYDYPETGAVLYDFYTHPAARGRGLYTHTISTMLSDLAERGQISPVYISCLADNSASQRIILRTGFRQIDELRTKSRWLGNI